MDHQQILQDSLYYIEENLQTTLCAQELADRAGFSQFHYYRLFQKATGWPVMQYILRRRLLHAAYAMRCGSTGIEAALRYGFDTYAGFYRAFLREFGCTPFIFLEKNRAKKPDPPLLGKEHYPMITTKYAASLLRHWNLEPEPVAEEYDASSGCRREGTYRVGDRYLLKSSLDSSRLDKELALTKHLEAFGLLAETPVLTAEGMEILTTNDGYFALTRRIPSTPLTAKTLLEGDLAANARQMGIAIGTLHRALAQAKAPVDEVHLFENVKTWALPQVKALLALPEKDCSDYLETFGKLYDALPRQIIHRDLCPGNFLHGQEAWGFAGLNLSEQNVRIFDPCYAATAVLSELPTGKEEEWLVFYQNLLKGYDSVAKLSDAERQAVPFVLLANQFLCVAWFAGETRYPELLDTNRRMTRWLLQQFDRLRLPD